jgi:hypothetical protein
LTNKLELGDKVSTVCLPERTSAPEAGNNSFTDVDRYGLVHIAGTKKLFDLLVENETSCVVTNVPSKVSSMYEV